MVVWSYSRKCLKTSDFLETVQLHIDSFRLKIELSSQSVTCSAVEEKGREDKVLERTF
jgi:hypothetical protein